MSAEVDTASAAGSVDELAGFGTRAVMMEDLAEAVEPTSPSQTLAIFDLRGYCNAYGTVERDSCLRRLARRLTETVPEARFYRPRSDEFVALVPVPLAIAEPQLTRAVSNMTAASGQPQILITFGAATLPAEAGEPVVAMRLADSRSYLRRRSPRERRLLRRRP
jgi:GGDEF domain-containing protein